MPVSCPAGWWLLQARSREILTWLRETQQNALTSGHGVFPDPKFHRKAEGLITVGFGQKRGVQRGDLAQAVLEAGMFTSAPAAGPGYQQCAWSSRTATSRVVHGVKPVPQSLLRGRGWGQGRALFGEKVCTAGQGRRGLRELLQQQESLPLRCQPLHENFREASACSCASSAPAWHIWFGEPAGCM